VISLCRMNFVKKLFFLVALGLILACEVDSNCGGTNVNYVTLSSFQLTGVNREEEIREVNYDSIKTDMSDSLLISDSLSSNFRLPLDPGKRSTTFYFYYDETADTIVFSYDKRNRVDSPECGVDFAFTDLDTVLQTFDSLIIVNDTLRRTIDAPNIKFYINQ